jgi:hypothetical protein
MVDEHQHHDNEREQGRLQGERDDPRGGEVGEA